MSEHTTGTLIAEQLPIKLRAALEADAAFIFNSWLRSYRFGDLAKNCDNAVYFSEHHKLIEGLLKRCKTVIACASDNPADIYGYICYEQVEGILVMHYCYVKHSFRNMGIARELMVEAGHDRNQSAALFTHFTEPCRKLQAKLNLVYHPYILLNYQGAAK
jgi:hypothetical protein